MSIKTILTIDLLGSRSLPKLDNLLSLFGDSTKHVGVSSSTAARCYIESQNVVDIVIANTPDLETFTKIKNKNPDTSIILVTSSPMRIYSKILNGKEEEVVDYFIANSSPDSWPISELALTLSKILKLDTAGAQNPLNQGAMIHSLEAKSSTERESINQKVMDFAIDCQAGHHLARAIYGVAEELLMNAIYDAPAASKDQDYKVLSRNQKSNLKDGHEAKLTYGSDGERFVVSVKDPFGAFRRDTFFSYVKKILRRDEGTAIVDQKVGGAGLGIFKILYSCHSLLVTVVPDKMTEVTAIFDLNHPSVDYDDSPRTVLYFGN